MISPPRRVIVCCAGHALGDDAYKKDFVAPALALRNRMQEAFGVTHALAPPRQVPPGGAEGWRLQHGEHLLLRDAADNLVASLALDKPKRESHDEI